MAMMAQPSQHEEALVRRVQQGDDGAFDRLVELCAPRIINLAYRLVGNMDDAQDLAQEALLRVYQALPRFKGDAAFSTWLYRIVTNVCYDELKRRRRRPDAFTDLQAPDEESVPMEDTLVSDADPAEMVLSLERQQRIQQAITELPDTYRMVVVLYDLQGLNYQQIADTLQQNIGTVKSRLNRGRCLLREKLSEERELFSPQTSRNR